MSIPILTFFNNKGGVGKTSLVYHLAWMYAEMDKTVVVVDLDPQANLTLAFLEESEVEALMEDDEKGSTVYQCVKPLTDVGDIRPPVLRQINEKIFLVPGDIALSSFEDILAENWSKALGGTNLYRPLRVLSSFWTIMDEAAKSADADIVLVDIGPNLGVINRSALIATNFVVIPLGADLFSMQGLKNLGPTIKRWSKEWKRRLENWKESEEHNKNPGKITLPSEGITPAGYLLQQPGVLRNRPVKAYDRWARKMPEVYREFVLSGDTETPVYQNDPHCLAVIKHYRSLVPLAQQHRKPIFNLTPADDAFGSHASAVQGAKKDFTALAQKIAKKIGLPLP